MPRKQGRRARKGASQNAAPRAVVAMTQSEAFERQVVRSSDATALRGKLLFTGATATTATALFTLNASSLGTRCAAMAGIFTRYRFKYVRVKFLATGSSGFSAFSTALGVYDDASTGEGQPPTTLSNVAELRASGTVLGGQTIPTFFEWKPADPNLWYYCSPSPAAGSDLRLIDSGVLYAIASTAASPLAVEIDFSLVYKGAVDTSGF